MSRRERVYAVAEETRAAAGGVDVLINNAGVVSGRSLLDIPDEKIEATFAVNTLSLFWVTKAVLPDMLRRGEGHIVTIASASGLIGVAKLSDYAASKWAAVGFDESLRAELRQTAPGVRTTVVCPCYIDTGMFRGVKSRFPLLLPILKETSSHAGSSTRSGATRRGCACRRWCISCRRCGCCRSRRWIGWRASSV